MKLDVKKVENLLRAGVKGRYTDDEVDGLMLCVEGPTSAAWSLRWQRDRKTRQMGLGSALEGKSSYLSLATAREKARREYERLADGIDPLELKRADKGAIGAGLEQPPSQRRVHQLVGEIRLSDHRLRRHCHHR